MWAPALAALVVTAAVVAAFARRALRGSAGDLAPSQRPVIGLGLVAVLLATVLVVVLPSPALPVAVAGAAVAGFRLVTGKTEVRTVLVNNLPAASLLAARTPGHPFALLIGLNLGPNLFATGSLAWLLWLRAARDTGAEPSIARANGLAGQVLQLADKFPLPLLAVGAPGY